VAKLGDVLEYKAPPKPPPILCDVCEDGTEAVVFCVESEKKLCEQHQQVSYVLTVVWDILMSYTVEFSSSLRKDRDMSWLYVCVSVGVYSIAHSPLCCCYHITLYTI